MYLREVLAAGLACGLILAGCGSEEPEAGTGNSVVPTVVTAPDAAESATFQRGAPRETEQQRVEKEVRNYETYLEENPQGENRPAALRALGNLYIQKFQDYERAVEYYALYIQENQDDPRLPILYAELANCYEQLGWQEEANRTYIEITKRYPEDSDIAKLAQQKLRGE